MNRLQHGLLLIECCPGECGRRTYLSTYKEMAEWTGLEPATPGVTGRYSNQLNYRSEFWGANANGLINKATSSFVAASAHGL